jgi:hypothetical protein
MVESILKAETPAVLLEVVWPWGFAKYGKLTPLPWFCALLLEVRSLLKAPWKNMAKCADLRKNCLVKY